MQFAKTQMKFLDLWDSAFVLLESHKKASVHGMSGHESHRFKSSVHFWILTEIVIQRFQYKLMMSHLLHKAEHCIVVFKWLLEYTCQSCFYPGCSENKVSCCGGKVTQSTATFRTLRGKIRQHMALWREGPGFDSPWRWHNPKAQMNLFEKGVIL